MEISFAINVNLLNINYKKKIILSSLGSSKQCPIPKFGIDRDVRVCDACYEKLTSGYEIKSMFFLFKFIFSSN